MMTFFPLFTFLLPLILLTSCGEHHYGFEVQGPDQFVMDSYKIQEGKFSIWEMEGKVVGELPEDALEEYKDTIHEDDILNIALYHPTRTDIVKAIKDISSQIGFQVNNGKICLPDLPPIHITDLSLEEARLVIQDKYLEQIQDAEVFLKYKNRLIKRIEIAGIVSNATIPVDGKLRLYEALAQAHVPVQANFYKSYVIRDNEILYVDINKLIRDGDFSQNIVMKGGDKIFIAPPGDAKVMVMGEVSFPRIVNVPQGYISLREALVTAGGIPFTGDKRYIQVIRGNLLNPKVYLLNWNIITHLPNKSLLLMPGDTVYVTAKPITEWNRFMAQLLPSFGGISTVYNTTKIIGTQ